MSITVPSHASLPMLVAQAARRRPDAPALTRIRDRWRYGDLERAIGTTASFVRRRGCRTGDHVALLFRNSPEYVSAYGGILAAGCAAVPLNPHETAPVLARQVMHSGARLMLGDSAARDWERVASVVAAEGVEVQGIGAADEVDSVGNYLSVVGPTVLACWQRELPDEALAAILYTSGTTGKPKGVMLSHGNFASNTAAIVQYLGLGETDRGISILPFQFAYGSSVLHTHLAVGAELFIEESFAYPHAVLQRMTDKGVTGFSGVPSTYALLLARCDVASFDLSRLRYLTQAGGAMPFAMIQRVRVLIPHSRFFVMYGQTEATARLAWLPPERLDEKAGSVGVPVAGVELAVRLEDGSFALPGQTGEIVARGPNVMQGYLNDAESTGRALREGWLHTGDIGRRDDEGFLYVEGRSVEMIKVGSYRVSPQEVEEVIMAMPGIEEVGVAAMPDELLGQTIKAVIVVSNGAHLDAQRVRAHCRRHLAGYKVPRFVEFAAALPHTPSGKLRRASLS